jgi:pyruvyltransferase
VIPLYWWSPRNSLRGVAGTMRAEGRTWAHLMRYGSASLRNFGDELSPMIVEYLTGQRVQWAPIQRSQVVAVGSVVNLYAALSGQGLIFGSGVRDSSDPLLTSIDPKLIIGVRGPLSAQALGLPAASAIGDPALIVSELFQRRFPKRGVVLIPHFNSFSDARARSLISRAKAMGWRVVPATRPVDEVLESILRADLVLTNSLHGIVCSDAFRTPVQMVDFGQSKLIEPSFKYLDYAQSVGAACNAVAIDSYFDERGLARAFVSARDRCDAIPSQVDCLKHQISSASSRLP